MMIIIFCSEIYSYGIFIKDEFMIEVEAVFLVSIFGEAWEFG